MEGDDPEDLSCTDPRAATHGKPRPHWIIVKAAIGPSLTHLLPMSRGE